jgi:hydrogenase nickel incorporation protein HypA/HybF
MHELAVCQALIEQVEHVARQQKAERVSRIELAIGALSGVEPQLLEQAYPLAAAGTVAQDAELGIEATPVRVHCDQCNKDSDVAANRLVCRHCGNWRTTLVAGDELLLTRVEFFREQAHV